MAANSPSPAPFGSGTGLRGEYYGYEKVNSAAPYPIDYIKLAGAKLDTQFDGYVFANNNPGFGLNRFRFAARWTGYIQPRYSELYTFTLLANNGARLWINSQLVVDVWASPAGYAGNIALTANQKYPITIEFWKDDNGQDPGLTVLWSSANERETFVPASQFYPTPFQLPQGRGTGNGLVGRYFDDRNTDPYTFFAREVGMRLDPIAGQSGTAKDEFWMNWSAFPNGPDFRDANNNPLLGSWDYAARWTGSIEPRYSETYIFDINVDDGARLWINGKLILDAWTNSRGGRAKIDLQAGKLYPIKIEFNQLGTKSEIILSWISYTQQFEVIPKSRLYSSNSAVIADDPRPSATLSTQLPTRTATATTTKTTTLPTSTPTAVTCDNMKLITGPFGGRFVYRAPITGNPVERVSDVDRLTRFTRYAVDPITSGLWLSAANTKGESGWIRVNTEDKTLDDSSTLGIIVPTTNDDPNDVPGTLLVKSSVLQLFFDQCIKTHLLYNASLTIPDVSWDIQPQFDTYPLSIQEACSASKTEVWGLGKSYKIPATEIYGYPGYHIGADFFARNPPGGPSSFVYSIGSKGLVVGIGVSRQDKDGNWDFQPFSAGNWGSTKIQGNIPGYTVIIRYGHLYVLYGHLKIVDPEIYVGQEVSSGTKLGEIGTFIGKDTLPHLHLEIRNFHNYSLDARTIRNVNIFVQTKKNTPSTWQYNNPFGILVANWPYQALNIFDVVQFFGPNVKAIADDQSIIPTAPVRGLGFTLEGVVTPAAAGTANKIYLPNCILPYSGLPGKLTPTGVYQLPDANGYRGFTYQRDAITPPWQVSPKPRSTGVRDTP